MFQKKIKEKKKKKNDFFTKNRKPIQICVSFIDFRYLSIFHPLFGLESQNMTLSEKCKKKMISEDIVFTQLFRDVEKLRRKPKKNVKFI